MKRFICVFLCSFLLIGSILPLCTFAETVTYSVFTSGMLFHNSSGTNIYVNVTSPSNSEIRAVCFTDTENITSSTRMYFFLVSSQRFKYRKGEGSLPSNPQNDSSNRVIDGVSYDYAQFVEWNFVSTDIPVILWNSSWGNVSQATDKAIYFTFGDGAVSPEPPAPSYSRPANVQYNTRISGSGAAAANNIDRITWDSDVDTNGKELPQNARVQIRAIPGLYTGTTKQDLLTKTYTDFVIDNTKAVQLVDIIASRGVYETKWSEVTAHFNIPFSTFYSLIEGDSYWYRNGWIYQIRLQVDDYISEWVNIYTSTGSGVVESETITNSDTLTQKLVQQIQIINNLNETTTNWYISETEINMEPYEEPGEGEKPWWAYLLEAITNLVDSVVKGITNIISSLSDLAGDIIDGILGLFSFDSFEVDDWSTQQQQIKDNSGMFGQALDFTHSLQQTFEGVEYQEPILHFDGVTIDNVEVIPEQTYNLNVYVESLGLTNFRNLAYLVMDGFIYFSLVLLIIRKLEGIFKK